MSGRELKAVEINFLCVHKQLRSKRLAPVLIVEITRRVNLLNIWQALYTAGVVIPTPFAQCRYYHRSLRPRKLIEVGFSGVPAHLRKFRDPMAATEKMFGLPETPKLPLVPMERRDVPSAMRLLARYLAKFKVHLVWRSEEEFAHWFLPRKDTVYSYVMRDATSGQVTDIASFYSLPSSVLQHPAIHAIECAYAYYQVPGTTDLESLMRDVLVLARAAGFDVFNAIDILDHSTVLEKLKFGRGDGGLNYYLFNYALHSIAPKEVGITML